MKIKKAAIAGVGILSAVSCATLRNGPTEGAEKIPLIESIEATRFTLPNGLRLLVHEDHSAPTFAIQTWFDVGSRNEEPGKTGLAHLFEHMMFKGTKAVPDGEFDRTLDEAGAEGQNAYTSNDETVYLQELPKERLELILKLESDRMRNLVVDDKSFSTEREVVQNERRFRNENSPDGLMYQEIYGLAYTAHPYRWPVIGYEEDLAKMSAEDARAFYMSHYAPNRAVIVVSGDVDAYEVRNLVEKYYGGHPKVISAPVAPAPEPEQKAPRRKTLRLNVQVEKLLMAYPIPSTDHADLPALEVAATLLSGGRSSRLQKALVESGIASDAYGYAADKRDSGLFIFGVSLQDKMKANLAEKVILRELERLAREEVSQLELDRARNLISLRFYSSLETNSRKADFMGQYEVQLGRAEKGVDRQRERLSVTPAKILEVAQKYFEPQRRSVVVGLKKVTQ